MKLRQFFFELQRRNVYKVAAAYAVVSWLLIQIATQVFPYFDFPNWGVRLVVLLLVLGFPVALVLAWAFELTEEGIKRTEDLGPGGSPQRYNRRRLIAFVVVLAALAVAFPIFHFTRSRFSNPLPIIPADSSQPIAEKSMAVLPFKPLSGSNRDEVLELGMADTLIAKLSASRQVIIVSLSSVRKYDELKQDPVSTGRLLRVSSILEGNLQRLGDRIRVTVRLIKVLDGSSLWAGTFDEKFTDVFAVQDVIAEKVAAALSLRLNEEERTRVTKRYTDNTEAYQLYLKGRYYWNKYKEEGFRKSIDYFKQALEKDPNYALAYAGLADSYSIMADLGYAVPNDAFPKARVYAQSALKLDETLADAHLSLGIVKLFYDADLKGTEAELRRSKELNPNNAQAYHFYAHYLQVMERLDEAIVEMRRSANLDPTSVIISNEVACAYIYARKFEDCVAETRKTLELDPADMVSFFLAAVAYAQLGKYDEALAEMDKTKPPASEEPPFRAIRACIYAKTGKPGEAQRIAEELNGKAADPRMVAWIYTTLGDKDQAFAALNRLPEFNRALLLWARIDPILDPLKSDPRFPALLRHAGFNETQTPTSGVPTNLRRVSERTPLTSTAG